MEQEQIEDRYRDKYRFGNFYRSLTIGGIGAGLLGMGASYFLPETDELVSKIYSYYLPNVNQNIVEAGVLSLGAMLVGYSLRRMVTFK